MMKSRLIVICMFLIMSIIVNAQTDVVKLDCIEKSKICNYEIENGDTLNKQCIDPFYPIYEYMNYGEDCLEQYWLYKYSWVLKSIEEKILYNDTNAFTRILLLKGKDSKLIRIEKNENLWNYTIKHFELDTFIVPDSMTKIEYQLNSYSISEDEHYTMIKKLKKCDIYFLEAHPAKYFAFSDIDIICFESNWFGGYTMTDLFIPFIKSKNNLKAVLKFIEKTEKQNKFKQKEEQK